MGRPRTPPEMAQLKGNPRKEKLLRGPGDALGHATPRDVDQAGAAGALGLAAPAQELLPPEASPPAAPDIDPPDFLTGDRERAIFKLIVDEFLPRNLVRVTDFNSIGRYAVYMSMWIAAKEELNRAGGNWYKVKSKHVPEGMLRRHPSFQDMLDLGHELKTMEPQLALTPLARNAIMARFMQGGGRLPPDALPFGDAERRPGAEAELPTAATPASALGFLAAATPQGEA